MRCASDWAAPSRSNPESQRSRGSSESGRPSHCDHQAGCVMVTDFGSEGRGFESFPARQPIAAGDSARRAPSPVALPELPLSALVRSLPRGFAAPIAAEPCSRSIRLVKASQEPALWGMSSPSKPVSPRGGRAGGPPLPGCRRRPGRIGHGCSSALVTAPTAAPPAKSRSSGFSVIGIRHLPPADWSRAGGSSICCPPPCRRGGGR